jgi:signal transduction histidine kinase
MIISVILGSLLMYVISGVALKQVRLLAQKIASIDKNELSFRITDFSAGDELNKLADSFNMMLTKLDIAFARESRFSADAAHELKTPLTVIKTNLDVLYLDESPTKEDCLESLEVVKKQTNRMIALVDDLLAMSTASVCNIDNYVEVDVMLEEIAKEFDPKIKEMHIRFDMDVKACSVKANYVMLKHAISNILENSIKYNYQDGEIEIKAYPEENDCVIYISDTGIGISEEHVKYIFEPFYRVDKSRSRKIGGSGLGLAIAYDIILKH